MHFGKPRYGLHFNPEYVAELVMVCSLIGSILSSNNVESCRTMDALEQYGVIFIY